MSSGSSTRDVTVTSSWLSHQRIPYAPHTALLSRHVLWELDTPTGRARYGDANYLSIDELVRDGRACDVAVTAVTDQKSGLVVEKRPTRSVCATSSSSSSSRHSHRPAVRFFDSIRRAGARVTVWSHPLVLLRRAHPPPPRHHPSSSSTAAPRRKEGRNGCCFVVVKKRRRDEEIVVTKSRRVEEKKRRRDEETKSRRVEENEENEATKRRCDDDALLVR